MPRRQIGMMKIIGLDPRGDEAPHERGERFDIVVDAAQQHALAQHRNAGVDQLGAGGARLGGQFARMIGMERDIDRLPRWPQNIDKRVADERGLRDRHACVNAQDFDMLDRVELRDDRAPSRRGDNSKDRRRSK